MNARSIAFVLVAIVAVLGGCKKDRAEPPPAPQASPAPQAPPVAPVPPVPEAPQVSWYRAALQAPDTELVFLLGLPPPGSNSMAVLKSGLDSVTRAASWDGKALRIEFPVYQTALHATLGADGRLTGAFESRSRSWGTAMWPLVATPIAKPEIAALATVTEGAPIDLGAANTVWKLTMVEEGVVRLELEQVAPGSFQATVAFANGNYAYLAGNGRGDRIVLTAFDGAGPTRLTLVLDADPKAGKGEWLTGQNLNWREKMKFERVAAVPLVSNQPSPTGSVLKIPQLAGLEGKPVIVELAGSWCSSCKNAAPELRKLHDEYGARGLAFVTLLYEFTDDPVANREQAEIFKKTYDIPWEVEAVPGTPEDLAVMMPPGFEKVGISGFPIALFLTSNHTIVAVHAGFPVKGSAAHADAVAAYRKYTALILDAK